MKTEELESGLRTVVHMAAYFRELKSRAAQLAERITPQERGYFTSVEEDDMRPVLVSYWHARNALFDLITSFQNDDELDDASRREQLARWIATKENPYFAKSYVNRIWSYLLGPGIIEPIDDIRAGNPPSNPALLERLTKDFIDGGFKWRHFQQNLKPRRFVAHLHRALVWNFDP